MSFMTKTLIVTYAPGTENSYTHRLVEAFIEIAQTKYTQLEQVELTTHLPSLISPEIFDIYYRRNYGGEQFTAEEQQPITDLDKLALQFKNADVIVLAFPVYVFSLPAAVKAYVEGVTQKGVTFELTPSGYKGLMSGKKLLVLSTSGGDSVSAVSSGSKVAIEQVRLVSEFMHFEAFQALSLDDLRSSPAHSENLLNQAVVTMNQIADEWYKV